LASASRATHSVAVAKATRWPARQARIETAIARCVLPVPGRAEQDDVLPGVQEVELTEVLDHLAADRALEGEVELLERLAGGEAGGLDARLAAVGLARGDLGRQQGFGEALVAPGLLARPLGELRQRPGGGRRLQLAEQVGELGGLRHAGISWS
jgi:hypothetical protein